MPERPSREDIISILDSIISGNNEKWPRFSEVNLHGLNYIIENNSEILTFIIQKRPETPINPSIEAAQSEDPAAFARLYRAVCDAYYSAPAVVALVADLADSGPREASPHFETALLDKVVARQAGKRRL